MKVLVSAAAMAVFAFSANAEIWCDAPVPAPYDAPGGLEPTSGSFGGTSCDELEAQLMKPTAVQPAGGKSAPQIYEDLVSQFFINMCHRRLAPLQDGTFKNA